jgi:hypothetical protein
MATKLTIIVADVDSRKHVAPFFVLVALARGEIA